MSKGGGHSHHGGHFSSSRSHHHHHHGSSSYRSTTYVYNNGYRSSYYSSSSSDCNCRCTRGTFILFFISILLGILFVPFIILSVGSHKKLEMDSYQTTVKSLHPMWIKSVKIKDDAGNGAFLNAALYSSAPTINKSKTHTIEVEETPTVDLDSYVDYSYQLNQGSKVSIQFSVNQAVNFYVQKGENQFNQFTDDVDAHHYKLKKYCERDPRTTWRSYILVIDYNGKLIAEKTSSFYFSDDEDADDVASTASEWVFITDKDQIASIIDLDFGAGIEILNFN